MKQPAVGGGRRRLRACWLIAAGVLLQRVAPLGQASTPEYQLKAAFISKFPQFTEWPANALDNRKTIDICVAQPNPFNTTLAGFLAGESLRGRPLVARDVGVPAVPGALREIDACHVLFLPGELSPESRELLVRAQRLPVLTVGESSMFLDEGGVVYLRLVDGRVRFEINAAAASRAGLRLSSQLLRLALAVHGGQP